ncbi:CDP-glycerol glycerophosphotransferase family protein [Bhargavaea massiliensis]|uniref:CDP-glycerol glycerophosphotransferase family protein n=1 Tax=Bhargavaea massiliensis TaxID=2697500 RepID=UPI001BCA8385|nr:CDP-glycerol glycerophosphotransferase family protein [Bhargavaea massiliensis]
MNVNDFNIKLNGTDFILHGPDNFSLKIDNVLDESFNTVYVDYIYPERQVAGESDSYIIKEISYRDFKIIVSHRFSDKQLIIGKVSLKKEFEVDRLVTETGGLNSLSIKIKKTAYEKIIDLSKLKSATPRKVFDKGALKYLPTKNIVGIYTVNDIRYFLFLRSNGIFIVKNNIAKAIRFEKKLKVLKLNKHYYIYGKLTHRGYRAFGKYEYLYLSEDAENSSAKFVRPFRRIKFLKRFGFYRIPKSDIEVDSSGKHVFYAGNQSLPIHPLTVRLRREKFEERFWKIYKKIFNRRTKKKKNEKLIIFESFNGRQLSDSPRAIYEYMKEYYPNYRMVWSADRRYIDQFKGQVEYATRFSLKWLFLFPKAKYWVVNSRLPLWIRKDPNTIYLQTWHGTPLKKLGVDIEEVHMPDTTTNQYHRNFVNEARKWNYLVSPNQFSSETFRRAFKYKGELLETGYPRNDFLIKNNNLKYIQSIKERVGIPLNKKVILYAPTWRDDQYIAKGQYKTVNEMDLSRMKKEFGDEYIVLLRMHYLVADKVELQGTEGFAYNMSDYPDIRDLYLVADILITDYSSVYFDYSILNKPMLFYMYDIEKYRDKLRGFYFDIEQHVPGPICTTMDELVSSIVNSENETSEEIMKREEFRQHFVSWEDGNATERVVRAIFDNNLLND